jgi:Flp pilus assembly pilin Flp
MAAAKSAASRLEARLFRMAGGVLNHFRNAKKGTAERGQTLVEYALLLALISVALIGALGAYQGGLAGYMQGIIDTLVALFG